MGDMAVHQPLSIIKDTSTTITQHAAVCYLYLVLWLTATQ